MRFVTNFMPLLRAATTKPPHFSRSVSILGAGSETAGFDFNDVDLKNSYSALKCANHTVIMNDFMTEEFAKREPGTTFIHSSPGIVTTTSLYRELPLWGRVGLKILTPLFYPFTVGLEETGQRQLYIATSGVFPPLDSSKASTASGVSISNDQVISKGPNDSSGGGAYLAHWKGYAIGNTKNLNYYREKGLGKTAWDHTMAVFARVEKDARKAAD
ncbi:short-chain dehydrogenase [Phlyctema vagabunda]|uniref:Short-chain dehydrogenase n=1 Tax=Phlyctema vagabunda TaxID=108571 RepID=A0ABR4P7Q3_9HELO